MGMVSREGAAEGGEFREIVMGLRLRCAGMPAGSVDVHAQCVLQDGQGAVLERIHTGNTRNAGGSVVHTGAAVAASRNWDHERIFIFLDALPQEVARLSFSVASATGKGLGHASGASCHISDHNTEQVIFHREVTVLRDVLHVALLLRRRGGWKLVPVGQTAEERDELDESLPLLARPGQDRLVANG